MSETSGSGVSRRRLLQGSAVAGTAAALTGVTGVFGAGAAQAASKPGGSERGDDLILTGGEIHTMDAKGHVVSTLAIHDGRVVYAGSSLSKARNEVRSGAREIKLHGKVALPGLIDCHNHLVLMGNRPGHHTPLENAYSIKDVQKTYAARAAGVPKGSFITTIGGFHYNQLKEAQACRRWPSWTPPARTTRCTSRSVSTGPSVTNTLGAAFFTAGSLCPCRSARTDPSPSGDPTGRATLALRDRLTFAERKQSVRDAMAWAVSQWASPPTSTKARSRATDTPSDNAASENNYTMHLPFLSVYDDGDGIVRLRINFLQEDTDATLPSLNARLSNAFKFFGNDMVRTGAIGEFIVEPFLFGQTFTDAAIKIAQAGWRAEVHSLTATDFQSEIQAFEAANAVAPITDLRWVVAHVPQITPDYVQRLKALGGGINLTGWQYLAGVGPQAGPPYRMIVDSGIPMGMSSDGMQIAPMNPWIHCYFAVTGINALGNQINPGQQITRHEAIQHYTRANGWFLGTEDEHQLGTLEVGRLGDVTVLDRDYFTVPVEQLKQIRSVLTTLGGEVVHDTLTG